ncbi:hypothetical protein NM688_g1484 [Phlebia brevispora]|uniref:Uncharacterized protein n=1 Tax=Phlebia brevispora TaxID=194682 RepID=A0ACC1TBQ0_9APHY|nr:hypothetical protein NM688_g1484 [Phlebia brevispora]
MVRVSTPTSPPPEISDRVIDFLHNDKRALASCSLVCREWSFSSRFHLFRFVKITHPTTLDEFSSFLDSSSDVTGYVRELSVHGSHPSGSIMYECQLHVTVNSIATCLAKLPSLRAVTLQGIWWKDDRDHSGQHESPSLPPPCPSVERLELRKIFTTPLSISDTIDIFPSLQHLCTESVYWTFPTNRLPQRSSQELTSNYPKVRLSSLTFGRGSSFNMLSCLLPVMQERVAVTSLRSLSLNLEHLEFCEEIGHFMSCFAPYLQRLHLRFGNIMAVNTVFEPPSFGERLRLIACTSLRTFSLDLLSDISDNSVQPKAWAVLHTLLPLVSFTVEHIVITHRLDAASLRIQLADFDWSMLDDMLNAFEHLERVSIVAEDCSPCGGFSGAYYYSPEELLPSFLHLDDRGDVFLTQRLPKLHDRGLLHVGTIT